MSGRVLRSRPTKFQGKSGGGTAAAGGGGGGGDKRRRNNKPPIRKKIKCPLCNFESWWHSRLDLHLEHTHSCRNYGVQVPNLNNHACPQPPGSNLGDEGPRPGQINLGKFVEAESAHRGIIKLYRFTPAEDQTFDEIVELYEFVYDDLHSLLAQLIQHFYGIRVQITLYCHLVDPIDDIEEDTYFSAFSYRLTHPSRINEILGYSAGHQMNKLNEFSCNGSGWNLEYIHSLDVSVGACQPLRPGAKKQPLPKALSRRQGVLNFETKNNFCFHYAVVACLHAKDLAKHQRYTSGYYEEFLTLYDFSMLDPPVAVDQQLQAFEVVNEVSVNVFAHEGNHVYAVRVSESDYDKKCDLLILTGRKTVQSHFAAIYNFDKFANYGGPTPRFFCRRCFNGFTSPEIRDSHSPICQIYNTDNQIIDLPKPGSRQATDVFSNFTDLLLLPAFGVYDFESFLKPVSHCAPDPEKSWKNKTQQHMPSSYAFLVVLQNGEIFHQNYYDGPDPVDHFLDTAEMVADRFLEFQKQNDEIEMSDQEFQQFHTSLFCKICGKTYDGVNVIKTRHHYHCIKFNRIDADGNPYRSNYLGDLCSKCNIRIVHKKRLTLLAHNSSKYDLKCILSNMKNFDRKLKVIPRTAQRFVQLTVNGKLRLIDSYMHLTASLSALVNDLRKDGINKFVFTRKVFEHLPQNVLEKLFTKLHFPYSFVTDNSKLDYPGVPDIKYFYNDLTDTPLEQEKYDELCQLFLETGCKSLGDLGHLYCVSDTCLLMDCLYNYVENSYQSTKLDPLNSSTMSGFAMRAMRYHTRAQPLEILTDPDQLAMVSEAVRGGICSAVQRLAYSNTPQHPDTYDPTKPGSEIVCFDVNALYAYSLTFPLPVGGYRFLNDEELANFDILSYGRHTSKGCFLTGDFFCPDDPAWQELHKQFPLGQKRYKIKYEDLSDTQQTTIGKMKEAGLIKNFVSQTKLVLSFWPLLNHTVHIDEAQYMISRGMIMKNVTKVLEFYQKPFLKEFVEYFVRARTQATSETQKQFLKTFLNSIYGRLLLNTKKFVQVHLAMCAKDARKYLSKHNFKNYFIVHENLSVFTMKRVVVKYRQHYPLGASVLAISKVHNYHIFYDRLLPIFPDMRLLSQDTDSFWLVLYFRKGQDSLIEPLRELSDLLDTSNLDPRHLLYSVQNAGKPGLLKFECKSNIIVRFCISSPKMYYADLYNPFSAQSDQKVASKGIPQVYLYRRSFEEFRDSIFNVDTQRIQFNSILGVNLDVATFRVSKLFLSPIMTQRFVLPDNINTLPFGFAGIPISIEESSQSSQS